MDNRNVPYIAFEAEMARHERTIRRLLIALIVAIALLFIVRTEDSHDGHQ